VSQPIKRYDIDSDGVPYPLNTGDYVRHSDYAALSAENERLKDDLAKWINLSIEHEKEVAELQAKVADLEARCRLLRRLGDEMAEALDDGEPNPMLVDWYFAKQGM